MSTVAGTSGDRVAARPPARDSQGRFVSKLGGSLHQADSVDSEAWPSVQEAHGSTGARGAVSPARVVAAAPPPLAGSDERGMGAQAAAGGSGGTSTLAVPSATPLQNISHPPAASGGCEAPAMNDRLSQASSSTMVEQFRDMIGPMFTEFLAKTSLTQQQLMGQIGDIHSHLSLRIDRLEAAVAAHSTHREGCGGGVAEVNAGDGSGVAARVQPSVACLAGGVVPPASSAGGVQADVPASRSAPVGLTLVSNDHPSAAGQATTGVADSRSRPASHVAFTTPPPRATSFLQGQTSTKFTALLSSLIQCLTGLSWLSASLERTNSQLIFVQLLPVSTVQWRKVACRCRLRCAVSSFQ